MGWVSGCVMMGEDVDHEEGEAGYFKSNDDRSIDPDIALSYIDEKLENVLGHFQKDFEGGVSAENLGAKFGGYGSFLPTYQRSPFILPQPRSPQRVHTNITHTPDHVHREGSARSYSIPDATLHERDGTASARNSHALYDDKVPLGDDLVKKIFDLPSDQVVEKSPLKHQPSPKKSHSLTDQKSLKFRIKVGSQKAAQKNVAIYSGLGLSSASTSSGNSFGESGGIPVESPVNPDKSPTRILQMLSTLTVALGPLLSPLPERLMNLLRDMPLEGKSTQALKDKLDHSAIAVDGYNSKVGDEDIYSGKKSNASRKCELAKEDAILFRVKENSGAKVLDSRLCGSSDESPKQQLRSIDNDGGSLGNSSTAMNTLKEPVKGNLMKNRKLINNRIKATLLGAEAVKDNSFGLVSGQGSSKLLHQEARSSSVEKIKDSPVDFPESRRRIVNGITISSKIDSDTFESERDSKGAADHLLQEGDLGATSGERDKLRMPDYKKKFTSESKNKSKISSDSVDDGRKASLSANSRQKKGSKKDTSKSRELYEDLFGHSEARGCPVGPLEKPSGDKSKSSNDTVKDEHRSRDRLKLNSKQKQVDNQPTSQSLVKDSLKYSVPSTNGLLSEMEQTTKDKEVVQATVPPVLLEDWVECDRCQQWRLLPYGRTEQLPEKWLCSMLDWLPGMNSCDLTEDETAVALRALYQLPLPDSQNSSQYTIDQHCPGSGNKHKLEQGVLEEAKLKRSSKRVSDQHVHPTAKKVKTGRTSDIIISSPTSVGSLGRIEFGSTTSVETLAPLKDKRESDGSIQPKGAKYEQGIVLQTRKLKVDMMDTNGELFDARHSSDSHVSLKKMKLMGYKISQNNVNAMKIDGRSLPDNKVPVVENGVTLFRKNKKPTVSQTNGDLQVTQKEAKSRKLDKGVDKEKQLRPFKIKVTSQLTMEDLESLKKDLASEPVPLAAANSSSSKVSDSRKIKLHYSVNRGSPVESVSSSPVRMSTIGKLTPLSHDDVKAGDKNPSNKRLRTVSLHKKNGKASPMLPKDEERSMNCKEEPERGSPPRDRHKLSNPKRNARVVVPSVSVVAEDRKKDTVLSQPRDFSGMSELSKESKDFSIVIHESESLQGSSSLRAIASCVPGASVVLKEAEGFRDYADRLKNTGFGYECNETYFQAALKFLHGASLLEERPNESSKHGEMNQIQIFINSAKLCETCAEEYEKRKEMAAAALAYKCMEVAYMRVVYCKNVTANKLCHDLQASLQLIPQGESPSSSASDIDNLNNLALVEKSTLSKSNVLASQSRSTFARLLDFTKDVNSAVEATRKSHDALAAANVILEKAKNTEGIVSVKRVIDFSFQDVEELVRLVGFAKEAINRKKPALLGNRN